MCEPSLRLAPFLRESCARNLYGLSYLDREQTLLRIPWPVVPKQSSGVPPGFEIFHDWAVMSMHKRNRDPPDQHEAPTHQKHRFRNALAKANGIKYRDDIKINGARVYQFADNQQPFCRESNVLPSPPGCAASTSAGYPNEVFSTIPNCSSSCYPPPPVNDQEMTLFQGSPPEPIRATPSDTSDTTIGNTIVDISELFGPNDVVPNDVPSTSQLSAAEEMQPWSLTDLLQLAPEDATALEVKVCFRQEDASRCFVTDRGGCRLYFGPNIPDLSQLLEKDHLNHIMKMFRYERDHYFGPETWQQIQLPLPNDFMRSSMQKQKTEAILANMERGLLLYIDRTYQSGQLNVPDVYAMRLCQTRIFPCHENASQIIGFSQAPDSLERMKWTKVFDGKKFCEQFAKVDLTPNPIYPSPQFSLSLGQRPSTEERSQLFVCITVTVQRAQQLIQNRLDNEREVCISYINSSDLEASNLATRLTETLKLQHCEKVY